MGEAPKPPVKSWFDVDQLRVFDVYVTGARATTRGSIEVHDTDMSLDHVYYVPSDWLKDGRAAAICTRSADIDAAILTAEGRIKEIETWLAKARELSTSIKQLRQENPTAYG